MKIVWIWKFQLETLHRFNVLLLRDSQKWIDDNPEEDRYF